MKNVRVGMSVLAAIMLVAASASAATTWTGTNSNVWTDGGNWDAGLPGDAVIGDTAVGREITNAGGTIAGFTWDQSSAAVSQITLGSDLRVTAGPGVFNNTSGSAGNMVLDLNGYDFYRYTTYDLGKTTVRTSSPGGTITVNAGTIWTNDAIIGPGVTLQGSATSNSYTLSDDGVNSLWDPTSVVLVRNASPESIALTGLTVSGAPRVGNVLLTGGNLSINGGLSVQGDVTFGVLDPTVDPTYGEYMGLRNVTNNPNYGLRVGGNWDDPNPNGNYHGIKKESGVGVPLNPLRLQFDGGGNVQTFYTEKSDVEARLQVDEDSHLQLDSDFISTYANPGGIIESSLSVRSTVDLGSNDLSITTMTMYAGSAGDAPTIIYGAGSDTGTFSVDQLISANWMNFVIENAGGFAFGSDITLLSYNSWTGITDFSAARADVTLPAGWSYDSLDVSSFTGPGAWTLTNVVPEPMTMSLLLIGGLALVRRRR